MAESSGIAAVRWREGVVTHRMVRSVMTASVATVSLDTPFKGLAAIMAEHGVNTLAGIITPRDLLRVYLRTDDDIRREILGEVISKYLGCDPDRADVAVTDGIVTLRGEVERKSMVPLAARMARSVDGVVDVVNELAYAIDDSRLPTATELDEP